MRSPIFLNHTERQAFPYAASRRGEKRNTTGDCGLGLKEWAIPFVKEVCGFYISLQFPAS